MASNRPNNSDGQKSGLLTKPREWLSPFTKSGYDVLRFLLAVLLLVTAGLKAYQLATEPVLGSGVMDSRWFLIFVVEFELFFGLWLLSGLLPKPTWAAAVACFTLFTCVSLFKALSGHASCGCFGKVEINPWITATFDFFLVLSLLSFRPTARHSHFHIDFKQLSIRVAGVLVAWLLLGVPAALAMGTYTPASLGEDGIILGNDNIVILEPEKWIGKQFPLSWYIDIGERFESGLWIVLLVRPQCPACRSAILQYQGLANDFADKPDHPTIAIVECPPYLSSSHTFDEQDYLYGYLDSTIEWKVETPLAVLVDNNLVRNVFRNTNDIALLRIIWDKPSSQ